VPYNDYNYTTDHWYNYANTTTSKDYYITCYNCIYKHVCAGGNNICLFWDGNSYESEMRKFNKRLGEE